MSVAYMVFELSNILIFLSASSIMIVLKEKRPLVNYEAVAIIPRCSILNNSIQSRMACFLIKNQNSQTLEFSDYSI